MQKRCLQYRQVENAISSRTNGLDYHYGNLILKNGKPDMYLFDGGYYSFDGYYKPECHYYIADYQGNNRMVVNARTNEVEQITHYYPYGGIIGNLSSNQDAQKYKYSGKALAAIEKIDNLRREREALAEGMDRTYGLDLYDVEARQYDATAPVFDRPDPLAEDFTWVTPYNYCAGDPVNCVDPDGRRTIYINGFSMNSKNLGNESYWNEPGNSMLETFSQIDNSREKPIFLDGSVGSHYRSDGSYSLNPNLRRHDGFLVGDMMAADIASHLQRNENGDYVEPIYIVTHSMGASYAKGFVEAMVNFFEENGGKIPIITEFDFQPHQPGFQKAHP